MNYTWWRVKKRAFLLERNLYWMVSFLGFSVAVSCRKGNALSLPSSEVTVVPIKSLLFFSTRQLPTLFYSIAAVYTRKYLKLQIKRHWAVKVFKIYSPMPLNLLTCHIRFILLHSHRRLLRWTFPWRRLVTSPLMKAPLNKFEFFFNIVVCLIRAIV